MIMSPKRVKITEAQAEKLAKLTFLLAKACEDKEQYFIKLYDLTCAEFRLLRFLKDRYALNAKEVAYQIGVTQGRVTQILTTLEQKGYVTRDMDMTDRRNILIKLTDEAIPFVSAITKKHLELHTKVMERIPVDIRDFVLEAVEELLITLTTWTKEKPKMKPGPKPKKKDIEAESIPEENTVKEKEIKGKAKSNKPKNKIRVS